ncbi:MAG: hypothetical protein IAG10_23225 [Planctomycetaceae bacterium]|nr:hypothetical protein [Planctomycetaceae bacterium]
MSAIVADELNAFHQFLSDKLKTAMTRSSPEQVLEEWRALHPDPDDVEAIRESLAAMHAGDRGLSLEDFDREFRQKNGLTSQS